MKIDKNNTTAEDAYMPEIPRSYSIDEILKAGGPLAFANMLGKKPELIENNLALLPSDSFLTTEELNNALAILNDSK